MLPAEGFVKNYHWGKIGHDNYISKFISTYRSSVSPSDSTDKPLAELWFGSHPSGPASVQVNGQYVKVDDFLHSKPEMIGDMEIYRKFNKKLPFLFKVLSISQPLSLQAHPDKQLAQILHRKDPKNYPDANHKPELMVALTNFELLCDFRPMAEISNLMKSLPALRKVVGDSNCNLLIDCVSRSTTKSESSENHKVALSGCFKALMQCKPAVIVEASRELLENLQSRKTLETMHLLKLIEQIVKLYPKDPGIFAPFFMNYLQLTPGQGVYLKPNTLHGYIQGECIECMACSDNVVRAGLTTKYRDVDTLLKMLIYETPKSSEDLLLDQSLAQRDRCVTTFGPNEEFKVDKILLKSEDQKGKTYTLSPVASGAFLLVLDGYATVENFFDPNREHKLHCGVSGFVPPRTALELRNIQGRLTIYRAYC